MLKGLVSFLQHRREELNSRPWIPITSQSVLILPLIVPKLLQVTMLRRFYTGDRAAHAVPIDAVRHHTCGKCTVSAWSRFTRCRAISSGHLQHIRAKNEASCRSIGFIKTFLIYALHVARIMRMLSLISVRLIRTMHAQQLAIWLHLYGCWPCRTIQPTASHRLR